MYTQRPTSIILTTETCNKVLVLDAAFCFTRKTLSTKFPVIRYCDSDLANDINCKTLAGYIILWNEMPMSLNPLVIAGSEINL